MAALTSQLERMHREAVETEERCTQDRRRF